MDNVAFSHQLSARFSADCRTLMADCLYFK
jgi:hypothetical protein